MRGLPDALVCTVFAFLPHRTQENASGVCRRWLCLIRLLSQSAGRVTDVALSAIVHFSPAPILRLDLADSRVTNASVPLLARIATLEELVLSRTRRLTDVNGLAAAAAPRLKVLDLAGTNVDDAGIHGLLGGGHAAAGALEELILTDARRVTTVRWLSHGAPSLRRLHLGGTRVGDEGLAGWQIIGCRLEELILYKTKVTTVSAVVSTGGLSHLKILNLGGCTAVMDEGIAGLERATALEELILSDTRVTSVSFLAEAPALKRLDIARSNVSNTGIHGLERTPRLQELILASTRVTNVSHLATAEALKRLDLSGTKITDLGGLERMVSLEELNLNRSLVTSSVTGFANARSFLKKLDLRNTDVIDADVAGLGIGGSPLEELILVNTKVTGASFAASTLKVLDLAESKITDRTLQSLVEKGIDNLRELSLKFTAVANVTVLSSARFLEKLDVSGTRVTDAGILGLEAAPALQELILYCTPVQNVSHLASAPALRTLNASSTFLSDEGVRGLERIATLEDLKLNQTRVTNVSNLSAAPALRKLQLMGTKVTDRGIEGLERIASLEELILMRTPVTNVTALGSSRSLRKLHLGGTQVTDAGIAGLWRIPNLQTLILKGTEVTDVRALADAQMLRKLDLGGTKVTDIGIRGIERLGLLEELILARTPVTNVCFLACAPALARLHLGQTQVTDAGIVGLEGIPSLTSVVLSATKVTSASALQSVVPTVEMTQQL